MQIGQLDNAAALEPGRKRIEIQVVFRDLEAAAAVQHKPRTGQHKRQRGTDK